MTQKAPALFVGHGSPMNAIEDTQSSRGWRAIAQAFPKPRAIVSISAHWITEGVRVTAAARPRTIHDFGGFPPELFAVQYPAAGDPALAERIVGMLASFGAAADHRWGLDHGTWSVLVHMYPEADVPVLQVSLDAARPPEQHYAIGRALAPLREDGVLLMGSGDIVHNLRAFFGRGATSADIEQQFDDDIVDASASGDHDAVLSYKTHPAAAHAAPDWDHFFPLFYVLGASARGERAHIFNRKVFPGVSMTSIGFGVGAT
ncbi:MAG: 4,5-DOPA dioxygenase extradiol [Hyphomonadaceae bacterium]|nr:4,5-DOPA dioxygenase extradiol [Hyphomonadaceae bacterium]